jgi:hypothetical protein
MLSLLGASSAPAAAGEPAPGGSAQAAPPGDASEIAEPELPSVIRGASSCPSPDAVWTELLTLVPRHRLQSRLRALAGEAAGVEIEDLGVPYRVIAGGRVREYRDETRDCGYRARIAAVFVALAIDPAEIVAPEPAPPVIALPAPAPAPEPTRPLLRLDVGAAVDAGVGPNVGVAQAGASIRAAFGRGRAAAVVGVTALVPVDTSVGGVPIHQQRFPADAGARIHIGRSRFEPYGELGVAVALLSVRGRELASPSSQTTVEVGARGALGMRLPVGPRFSPFGALHAEIVPMPPEIFALPRGAAGNTPLLWLGATVGVSMGAL